jgi:hypothetical protein
MDVNRMKIFIDKSFNEHIDNNPITIVDIITETVYFLKALESLRAGKVVHF